MFLNPETNVFYIDNALIDKFNFKFVKSMNSTNVRLINEFHMSSDKQLYCNFQMNTCIENTVIYAFHFSNFNMMLKYE